MKATTIQPGQRWRRRGSEGVIEIVWAGKIKVEARGTAGTFEISKKDLLRLFALEENRQCPAIPQSI